LLPALLLLPFLTSAQSGEDDTLLEGATGAMEAETVTTEAGTLVEAVALPQPPTPTAEQLQTMTEALQNSPRPGPSALGKLDQGPFPEPNGPPTVAPDEASQFDEQALPTDLVIFRNTALSSGGLKSGVDEPSTANNGSYYFTTGNWYAAVSKNAGQTWGYLDPFTLFGSGFCCDQVTVYDSSHNRVFWLLQFNDRLVLANSDGKDLTHWCSYSWYPSQFGFPAGSAFDYNHMAVSTNFVYVTTNVYPSSGDGGALVFRIPIEEQSNCESTGASYVFRTSEFSDAFVQAASDTMYWGTNWTNMTLGSSFRVLRWPDNSGTYYWYDRTIDPFSFMFFGESQSCASQDGVVLNWCERTDSRMSGGGYLAMPSLSEDGNDAVIGFAFNAMNDGSHPFPYIRRVYFKASDLTYLGYSEFYGTWGAVLYPDMAPDARGHIGMVFAWGGGTGTSHYKPGAGIMVDDDVSPTQPWAYNYYQSGNGNPCLNTNDGLRRWGDYLTVRPFEPSRYGWFGSTFALSADAGSCSATASVDVRNVAFGRERDRGAWLRWAPK
jgi:hypothetical protein